MEPAGNRHVGAEKGHRISTYNQSRGSKRDVARGERSCVSAGRTRGAHAIPLARSRIVDEPGPESYFQIGTSLVIGFIRKGRIRVRHLGRAGSATLVDPEQDTGEIDPGCFRLVAGDRLAGLVSIWD